MHYKFTTALPHGSILLNLTLPGYRKAEDGLNKMASPSTILRIFPMRETVDWGSREKCMRLLVSLMKCSPMPRILTIVGVFNRKDSTWFSCLMLSYIYGIGKPLPDPFGKDGGGRIPMPY